MASANSTSDAVWQAFQNGTEVAAAGHLNGNVWNPTVVAGAFDVADQDSFMYRTEHGVRSFLLDDDNCDCQSTLSAGHGLCGSSWTDYPDNDENSYGVDVLNDDACRGPMPAKSLVLYYR